MDWEVLTMPYPSVDIANGLTIRCEGYTMVSKTKMFEVSSLRVDIGIHISIGF